MKIIKKIKNIDQLEESISSGINDYIVSLGAGLYSKKEIEIIDNMATGEKIFRIFNSIDDSLIETTRQELENKEFTNIKEAMEKGAFYSIQTGEENG